MIPKLPLLFHILLKMHFHTTKIWLHSQNCFTSFGNTKKWHLKTIFIQRSQIRLYLLDELCWITAHNGKWLIYERQSNFMWTTFDEIQ